MIRLETDEQVSSRTGPAAHSVLSAMTWRMWPPWRRLRSHSTRFSYLVDGLLENFRERCVQEGAQNHDKGVGVCACHQGSADGPAYDPLGAAPQEIEGVLHPGQQQTALLREVSTFARAVRFNERITFLGLPEGTVERRTQAGRGGSPRGGPSYGTCRLG